MVVDKKVCINLDKITLTVNRLAYITCGFNSLVTLIEAHFWHFTEPTTLGVLAWPIIVLFLSLTGSGFFLSFPKIRKYHHTLFFRLFFPLICPTLLLGASLSVCDNLPLLRTVLLSISVFIFPFILAWCVGRNQNSLSGEIFICIFVSMSIRMSAHSINIFYESWLPVFIILLTVFISSIINFNCQEVTSKQKIRHTTGHTVQSFIMNSTGRDSVANTPLEFKELKEIKLNVLVAIFVVLQLTFGTVCSVMLFVQYFTSPSLFIRWSSIQSSHLKYVIFSISFLNSIFFSFGLNEFSFSTRRSSIQQQPYLRFISLLFFILSLLTTTIFGFLLFIYGQKTIAFVGACLICLLMPLVFSRIFTSLSIVINHLTKTYEYINGIVLMFAGFIFFIFHLIVLSFTLPTITSLLLGKMEVIVMIQIIFIFTGFCSGEVLLFISKLDNQYISYKKRISVKSITRVTTIFICVLLSLICSSKEVKCRFPNYSNSLDSFKENHTKNSSIIRALTWNVLLGHTMTGRDNTACVSQVLKSLTPDIAAFQESDPLPAFWGGKDFLGACQGHLNDYKSFLGAPPMRSTLGVAVMSRLEVSEHYSDLLPVDKLHKVLHYAYTKSSFKLNNSSKLLHVFTAHAVYKNWTIANLTSLSNIHLKFLADEVNNISNSKDPVILMGDLNLNPGEPQLNYLIDEAKMRSALHPDGQMRKKSTTFDTFVNIDHIFYKNLKLVHPATILTEVGKISDHSPVIADFMFS